MAKSDDFSFEVVKDLGEFGDGSWPKHLAKVKWNGGATKLDIRPWNEDMTKMGRGISLTYNEAFNLYDLLGHYFNSDEGKNDMPKE